MSETVAQDSLEIARAKQIFRFLKAFADGNTRLQRSISAQPWTLPFRELPQHPDVAVGEVRLDGAAAGEAPLTVAGADTSSLLRVRRPKLTPAPRPPDVVRDYLLSGWDRPDGAIEVHPTRNVRLDGETVTEQFTDSPERIAALTSWKAAWNLWSIAELPAVNAMRVFERLYDLWGRIERESEQVELMLGDGRLRWQTEAGTTDHPILLQRVELEFDPSVPEFRVIDADRGPELYGALLLGGDTISAPQLNTLRVELEDGGYHPLAREVTSGYLRRIVQLLGPRGAFNDAFIPNQSITSDPLIARDATLFLRSASTGYSAAFERVLQDLEMRGELPTALIRLVGVEPAPPQEEVERDDSPWGEPPDILLSKPANQEQIQIARALERHRAVLVQGPPGTGKSHTIANLIGHLVANGKRVLVTSHTTKALRVLRDQIVEELQPLCVAMLDNDSEGRKQMEAAVRGILSRLTSSNVTTLEREVGQLSETRAVINRDIRNLTIELRTAREAEYVPIVFGGKSFEPVEAARWVRDNLAGNDWIPAPVDAGAPIPLSISELHDLYATNAQLTATEDDEIGAGLPAIGELPASGTFGELVAGLDAQMPADLAQFWERSAGEDELPRLQICLECVQASAADIARLAPWQRAIVAAGYSGGPDESLWVDLSRQIGVAADEWEKSRALLLENDVTPGSISVSAETVEQVSEIVNHLSAGHGLGLFTLLTKPKWKAILNTVRVNGEPPKTLAHFRAIAVYLALQADRKKLAVRWARQAEVIGLPAFTKLPTPPEPILSEYAAQFGGLLSWWRNRWPIIASAAADAGFYWREFRAAEVAHTAPVTPFERDVAILTDPMQKAVTVCCAAAQAVRSRRILTDLDGTLAPHKGPICRDLRAAVQQCDRAAYAAAYDALLMLSEKTSIWEKRKELMSRLGAGAGNWASAIRERKAPHDDAALPGDANIAWQWTQLHQEIARRSALDEIVLAEKLHRLQTELRETTAKLIDRRAWLGQLRRTDLNARQALQGWADTQRRIGKGTGKRAPRLQAEARKLLAKARPAVPVWIMPLARVVESFETTGERFDVVIVDESSQSDVLGLLPWYLGDRIAVVGDHEQVSPSAVGQALASVDLLIAEHLQGIPNKHLYDGRMSVYDLARQSFGGTIALREHFRCVPDIIEFSNELAYNLEIRPLRNSRTTPQPHVVEYVVQDVLGTDRTGKANVGEARSVVALLKAAMEMPEYDDKTFGAITLLGDEQAGLIQDLAATLIGAVELEQRRFIAGNAAQFQGDERHVIFLSMVDAPTGRPLALRQTDMFKQRYNVAASRAKDQLWLVHSLDPARDLKVGDLRKTLIDYVRNPGARRRAVQRAQKRAESPFESAVISKLVLAGYAVEPQVWVGHYRIDMVVSGPHGEVALECDGDRFHGIDQIPDDMRRQAVLERAGWRFIRIRGTRYYRDPDATMEWVFTELSRLSVEPVGADPEILTVDAEAAEFRDRVVRRAWEIMRDQHWVAEPPMIAPDVDLTENENGFK